MARFGFILFVVAGAEVDDSRFGAIMGASLVDAAAMPLHWIYNTSAIEEKVQGGDPAFFSPPSCPFYAYPEGENSPYGQQSRVYLATLSSQPSRPVDAVALQDAYYAYYGPEGAPCHERQSMTHRSGCYWDASTKGFIANYEAGRRWPHVGANDTQANAVVHMIPVVAALTGRPGMLDAVEEAIRVTQNTDDAVAFGMAAARVLRGVILGHTPLEAVRRAAAELQDFGREHPNAEDGDLADGMIKVLDELDRPNFDVVQEVGQSCDYPFGLWSGSHLVAQISDLLQESPTNAFMNATRQTILAGGDSASRGTFVGAVLGAAVGETGLPQAWKDKHLHYGEMADQASALLQGGFVSV